MLIDLARRCGASLLLVLFASCGGGGGSDSTPQSVDLSVVVSGSGTVNSAPAGIACGADCSESYDTGTTVTLTAAPATGFQVTGWSAAGCPGTGSCVIALNASTSVTATFAPVISGQFALNVIVQGTGAGSVTSSPAGIDCGNDCSETYPQGTSVTLTATPQSGSSFSGWSGGVCTGTSTCTVAMSATRTATATFAANPAPTHLLTTVVSGSGSLGSLPAGITCPSDCTEAFSAGTNVTLTATPATGFQFTGWSGAGCTGTGNCVVAMNAAASVTATFTPVATGQFALTVIAQGSGSVTSTPAGINCGSDCTETYLQGTLVTLTATPQSSATFSGWSGACSGTGTCTVTMSATRTVTATFTQITRMLTVTKAGTGAGTVTSAPAGISCGGDCTQAYAQSTSVTLTAVASTGSSFAGWSGAGCTGTSTCTVSMTAATTVTATFTANATPTYALTVVVNGSGGVGSSPVGITCPTDCTESFLQGTVVTLAATPTSGQQFTGWTGACTGTSTCSVTMNAAATVTATFAASTTLGLTSRPENTSCRSFDPPTTSTASLTLQRTFSSLSFSAPIAMLQAPNDATRWFVVEKGGVVRVFANNAGVTSSSVFIDISSLVVTAGEEEAGLLGMAFDPNFGTGTGKNQNFYLFYSAAPNSGYRLRSTVARFTANAGATAATTASRVVLLGLDKLESNHNGGNIAFGPDGFLYIGFGDGGGDPNPQAQDDKFLFGKMLRINPNGTTGGVTYSIPGDNPNAGGALCNATGRGAANCPEVWARGLRNPWRWSFDKANGTLWVADVGWGSFEEVNIVTRNGNYGWPITEGAACVTGGCNRTGLTDPIYAVPRSDAQSITGGYAYRGTQTTDLAGQYIFGDFASKMFGAVIAGSGGSYTARYLINPYASTSINVSSFGEGSDGELFALDYAGGGIHRLAFSNGSGGGSPVVPTLLSATGCVNSGNPRLPAAGMVGYDLNAPFWSDNAEKERFFAMPSTTASFTPGTDGDWSTPLRSVIVKSFRLGGVMIETRLLMRQSNGDWAGYSYEWNDAQTDATLVAVGGKEKPLTSQVWSYPSRAQCLQCHTSAAGFSLGLETQQLNKNFTYSQTGINAHQLSTLSAPAIAMLTPQITNPAAQAKLSNPFGSDSIELRARAYLHTNCAMCHRPGGSTGVGLNLLASTALAQTGTCNLDPTKGTLGLANAKIIAPGLPDSSVLLARANSRDPLVQMPPIGSHVVDANGVALLRQWVIGLTTCN